MFSPPLYSQTNAVNRSTQGAGGPLPPSLAPVLTAIADPASFVANLTWTASNRTTSPGFTYQIWFKKDAGSFTLLTSTTALFYNDDETVSGIGTYSYYITPVNDAGGGPSSNADSVVLPGESDAPDGAYTSPDGSQYFVFPDASQYYQQP